MENALEKQSCRQISLKVSLKVSSSNYACGTCTLISSDHRVVIDYRVASRRLTWFTLVHTHFVMSWSVFTVNCTIRITEPMSLVICHYEVDFRHPIY